MKEKDFERWKEQVEIYCAALEEFLNECIARPQADLRDKAALSLLKLQARMDNLRSKYK
jgi:hypothetical protein